MWVIAGALIGLMVLVGLVGFHSGPHAHAAAGVIGVVAAAWLVVMAIDGRSAPLLWALLGADLVVSAGIGILAWKGLSSAAPSAPDRHGGVPEGTEAVAVSALAPEGVVVVQGEQWSAVSLNGDVPVGARVHVIGGSGVRLEVWREDSDLAELFTLDPTEAELDIGLNGHGPPPARLSQLSQSSPAEAGDPESKEQGA
jgi:membrane protein implicated in regulation of membrane protease activity